MSHHKRGVLDGVTHYCDRASWARTEDELKQNGTLREPPLIPWCHLKGDYTQRAQKTTKRAMVTCLQCLHIRQRR